MKSAVFGAVGGFVIGLVAAGIAATVSTSGTMTITIFNPLTIAMTPTSPTVLCNAPKGTAVFVATPSGGDGSTITASLTGSTDFVLAAPAGGAWPIVVADAGIAPGHCPVAPALTATQTVTFTATQP